jgi:putative transcriptional regulator
MTLTPRKRKKPDRAAAEAPRFLEGQLLIAMPSMTDKRFARSVIYMCSHTAQGAMGLIINQRAPHINFPTLLERLNLIEADTADQLSRDVRNKDVHVGGPVESSRGFVLHSADYVADDATVVFGDGVCLTHTTDILKAIAKGTGPGRSLLALGYAGWTAGQVESEVKANGWLNCAADADLIFDSNLDRKYERALLKIGVDPSHLVSVAGHA